MGAWLETVIFFSCAVASAFCISFFQTSLSSREQLLLDDGTTEQISFQPNHLSILIKIPFTTGLILSYDKNFNYRVGAALYRIQLGLIGLCFLWFFIDLASVFILKISFFFLLLF